MPTTAKRGSDNQTPAVVNPPLAAGCFARAGAVYTSPSTWVLSQDFEHELIQLDPFSTCVASLVLLTSIFSLRWDKMRRQNAQSPPVLGMCSFDWHRCSRR